VVRLIRSKGVGIFFVTQNPTDLPEAVLGQLSLKIQHALRAFTPKDQKSVRAIAASLVPNPRFDTAEILMALGVGEALVSVSGTDGRPLAVQRTLIAPPGSRIGPLSEAERALLHRNAPLRDRYQTSVDRHSAYEMLKQRADARTATDRLIRELEAEKIKRQAQRRKPAGRTNRQSPGEAMIASAARSIGSTLGRQIARGILGSLFGRR
jgi:DNA helicase HerA-like ATPase